MLIPISKILGLHTYIKRKKTSEIKILIRIKVNIFMYSKYLLLSALLVIGAETYAKNNKTEVESLLSYHNSVRNNSVDSSSQDSIFKDGKLQKYQEQALIILLNRKC